MANKTSGYEDYSIDLLAKLYFEIEKNIEQGNLSEAMHLEQDLIRKAIQEKGISLMDLHIKKL
ncbi:hypothetical protein [Pontibacillus marinus]|uniref:Uncharacterized protein n=1 Tax=Pontibacillus marinus BH030004 = DSM 16465 TaxID=1385511 RepID=A0A0A5G043_9BACI|nr:hypothetical protein [Pontibacillus marinus]KGX84435.1 hypothetical protein N783_17440 [Pontibacillus marinus BH030004 = DSM 16465]